MPISWWVDRADIVHLLCVVLFNCKEKWDCEICGKMALEITVLSEVQTLKSKYRKLSLICRPPLLAIMWEWVCRVRGTRQEPWEGRKASLRSGKEQNPWVRISGLGILKQGLGRTEEEEEEEEGEEGEKRTNQKWQCMLQRGGSAVRGFRFNSRTYIHLTAICDSCSRRSNAISGLSGHQACIQTYTCRQNIHLHKIKWNIFNTSKITYLFLLI